VNFPGAREIESWLEGLSTFRSLDPGKLSGAGDCENPRTLFILDNDFGELTTVLYLVLGQECFRDARILLSPRLHQNNHDALPGRMDVWTSEQDLARSIEAFQPNVVILASGYLLPVHSLLTADAMERLCALARRHNAVVVTTDPFLGLITQWSGRLQQLISIDIPEDAGDSLRAVKRSADAMLHNALSGAEDVLRNLPHLYPSYTDMQGVETFSADSRNVSFFNDALVLPPDLDSKGRGAGNGQVAESAAHWMFVISEADYSTQAMFLGSAGLAAVVARLLAQTSRLGRHAIFIGPAELLDLVKLALPADERIHLVRYCPFRRFMSLLLSAEYSFYWNVVSHSILMQLWNGRRVILFDRGHLARAVRPIYERIIAWYYQGCEPTHLDQDKELSLAVLEEAVAADSERRNQMAQRFRRAPSPAAVLVSLSEAAKRPPACSGR
jgi:hypothetical protein